MVVRDPKTLPKCAPYPELRPLEPVPPPAPCADENFPERCIQLQGNFSIGQPAATFYISESRYWVRASHRNDLCTHVACASVVEGTGRLYADHKHNLSAKSIRMDLSGRTYTNIAALTLNSYVA